MFQNPELRDDIVDSSGLRIWYTPSLRTHDAGSVVVGAPVDPMRMFIPQGMVTTWTSYCHADCTNSSLPEEGITVYATALHAHTKAVAMKFRHIRDGVELEPLGINEHYGTDSLTLFEDQSSDASAFDTDMTHTVLPHRFRSAKDDNARK